MKITNEEFLLRIKVIYKDRNYKYDKTVYTGSHNKVIITCPIHGDFEIEPRMIYKNKGCPYCEHRRIIKNDSRTKTTEEFIEQSKKIHGDKYIYDKTVYTKAHNKVIITCPIHGDFEQEASVHLGGSGCPKCAQEHKSQLRKDSLETFIEKAEQIHGNKYDYSKVDYKNNRTKVCIICPKHGEFWQLPLDHLSRKGCPKCSKSKGESFILNYLESHNIKYYSEYEIKVPESVRKSGKIRVDFYLPDYNLFIEYNGKQHYIPMDYFGGELYLKEQQNRDNYLRTYSLKNNINLLEISYQDNLEKCLENYL